MEFTVNGTYKIVKKGDSPDKYTFGDWDAELKQLVLHSEYDSTTMMLDPTEYEVLALVEEV